MALSRKSHRFLPDHTSVKNPEPMFEFEEGDIWNSNNVLSPSEIKKAIPISRKKSSKKLDQYSNRGELARSLPLSIPDWSKMMKRENVDEEDDDDVDGNGKVPPHEYLLARQMRRTQIACSFSVHEGRGRTLKGRDLSRVRNAIWEQTGFED